MGEKGKGKLKESEERIGFVASYKGQVISTAQGFRALVNKREVRELLGKKDLVIKHTVPEGMIAVY